MNSVDYLESYEMLRQQNNEFISGVAQWAIATLPESETIAPRQVLGELFLLDFFGHDCGPDHPTVIQLMRNRIDTLIALDAERYRTEMLAAAQALGNTGL